MSKPDRRQFLKKTATLSVAAGLGTGLTSASAAAIGPMDEPLPERLSRALAEVVRQKFSTHELAGQMKAIEEDILYNLRSHQALLRIPLQNSDEPDFMFVPE